MRFTLRQLEIFAAVMASGGIRGAAQRVHLSQAAISQAMTELAEALETRLFERSGRRLVPTAAARRLAALSEAPRLRLAGLYAELHGQDDAPLAGPAGIAASSTIARYYLPEPIAALGRAHPQLQLTLTSANSSTVEARVAEGEADLGFIEGPATRRDLFVQRWRTDQLEIIGPPDAPPRITYADLEQQRWIARERGSGTRSVFEQRLALAGVPAPPPALIVDDPGAQVRMVAAGAGLACVSRVAARSAAVAGQVRTIALANEVFERPLWSVRRLAPEIEGLTARLLDALGGPDPA